MFNFLLDDMGALAPEVVLAIKTMIMEEQVLDLAMEQVSSGEYSLDELQDILDMISHIVA